MTYINLIFVILALLFATSFATSTQNGRKLQKKTDDGEKFMSIRNVPDHWIAISRPQSSFPVTLSQSTTVSAAAPTSAPFRYISKRKRKMKEKSHKEKTPLVSERRNSNGFSPYKKQYKYHDLVPEPEDYERYYRQMNNQATRRNSYSPKYSFSSSSHHPVSPGASTAIGSVGTVYAESPEVSRFVIEDPSKYFVQRISPGSYYIKSNRRKDNLHFSGSHSVRRLDTMDYDDFAGGEGLTGTRSVTGFGPQSSFPPRQIMTKIAQPGQSQPCHGPECHQHHKGLVRFYWKRVVYPNDGRRRSRGRFPTMIARTQRRRRRLRDRAISPSDQRDTFHHQNSEENNEENHAEHNDEAEEEEDDDDEGEEEEGAQQYATWRPGRGYDLDLHEGYNYQENEKKIYRDKRRSPRPRNDK